MHTGVARLADKVLSGGLLDRDEAAFLTRVGGQDIYDLFYWANKIRVRFVGPDVRFCAIVAAKVGGCSEDCKFCAQSEHHDTPVSREQAKLTDEQYKDFQAGNLYVNVHSAENKNGEIRGNLSPR